MNRNITEKEYEYAQKVWDKMGCSTLQDYTMFYLRTDVLHLTDIYEEFRGACLKNYQLDPCWCYTTLGLSWSAMLKLQE